MNESKQQKKEIQFSQDSFVERVKKEKLDADAVSLFIIEAGIDINAPNSNGLTALMKAACMGHFPMVSLLASYRGIDVNQKGRDGWTPLMMAAQQGATQQEATDIVRFLVGKHPFSISIPGKKADVTVKNDNGETALTIAEKFGAPQELIDCLKDCMA